MVNFVGVEKALESTIREAREDKRFKDELNLSRQETLLGFELEKQRGKGSLKNSKEFKEVERNVARFKERYNQVKDDLTEEQEEFFSEVLKDDFAASNVMTILDDQETEHDTIIDIREVPTLITLINANNIPVQERQDFVSQIVGGDFTDFEKYADMARQIQSSASAGESGRSVFVELNPGMRIDQKRMLEKDKAINEAMQGYVGQKAYTRMAALNNDASIEEVRDIEETLQGLAATGDGAEGIKAASLADLFQRFASPREIYELGKLNPALGGFLNTSQGQFLVDTYNYPVPDTSNPLFTQMIDDLKSNPNDQEKIKLFDLSYGPGSARRYINE